MAWLACRHLDHLPSGSGFVCTQEGSVGQGLTGGLGVQPTLNEIQPPDC